MQIRVKDLKQQQFLIDVPEDGTVKDLKQGVANANSVEVERVKIVYSGKPLTDDNALIKTLGIKDATIDPTSFCVTLIAKVAPTVTGTPAKPATTPVATPVATPATTPVATPVATSSTSSNMFGGTGQTTSGITVSPPVASQVSHPNYGENEDEDDMSEEELNLLDSLGLGEGTDINQLLSNPKIVESIMQFRLQDPAYVQAYNMLPDDTQALLSNKAFIFVSMNEMIRSLAQQQGLGGAGPNVGAGGRTIRIEFLPTEGEDVKEKFKQLVDMGFNPTDVIQCLRANDYDMDMTLLLLTDLRKSDADDA